MGVPIFAWVVLPSLAHSAICAPLSVSIALCLCLSFSLYLCYLSLRRSLSLSPFLCLSLLSSSLTISLCLFLTQFSSSSLCQLLGIHWQVGWGSPCCHEVVSASMSPPIGLSSGQGCGMGSPTAPCTGHRTRHLPGSLCACGQREGLRNGRCVEAITS